MTKTIKKEDNSNKPRSLYCVCDSDNDFKIPRPKTTEIAEALIGNDIETFLSEAKNEDWDIDDKVVVYQLVPVGHIQKSGFTFTKFEKQKETNKT